MNEFMNHEEQIDICFIIRGTIVWNNNNCHYFHWNVIYIVRVTFVTFFYPKKKKKKRNTFNIHPAHLYYFILEILVQYIVTK